MVSQLRSPHPASDDRGVSEVIGVILMVAITVAIAATAYIWAGGFGDSGEGPESASATARTVTLDSDNDAEWIKFTLTAGENGPYDNASTGSQVAWSSGSNEVLCESPQLDTGTAGQMCEDPLLDGETWEVGSSKWFPCKSGNRHSISLAIEETALLDRTVQCEEAA